MCEKMYGVPPCQEILDTKKTGGIPMFLQMSVFSITIKNIDDPNNKTIKEKNNILRNACPEGHGFYVDISKAGDLPFDPWWEISNYFGSVVTETTKAVLRERYPASADVDIKREG